MTRLNKTALLTGVAVLMTPLAPALAAGTTQGTSITNTATVNYKVGGVDQTVRQSNTDSFVVDRKIIVTTTKVADKSVSPNEQNAFVEFTVTNSSNDSVRYALAAAKVTDANGALGTLVVTDSSGVEITSPVTLAADQTVTYRVRTNVADVANGSTGTVSLTATAVDAAGNVLAQSTGANGKTTVETVFADTAGSETGDAAKDGKHSARATFTVASAQLTVNKTSVVLSDGFSPATAFPNAKAIPGATVQYCIGVTNASGGASATDLVINDVVPSVSLTVDLSSLRVGATQNATTGQCTGGSAPTAANNTSAGNTVTVKLASALAAGATTAVSFNATLK